MNPKLKEGDRVIMMKMAGSVGNIIMGRTVGKVLKPGNDVFGETLYWTEFYLENGDTDTMNICSDSDIWLLEEDVKNKRTRRSESVVFTKKQLIESGNYKTQIETAKNNKQIIKNYQVGKLRKYLSAIRETGIVNMQESGFFLICGKERLEHFTKYSNVNSKKALEYALEHAEEVRNIMILGAMRMIEDEGKEVTPNSVESRMNRDVNKIKNLYMSFPIIQLFDKDDEEDENDYDDNEDEEYDS
jgi:hypothetical protein